MSSGAGVGGADLRERVEHRRDHALIAVRSASPSAAPGRARGPDRRASSPAPRAPTSARSGSSPEIDADERVDIGLRQRVQRRRAGRRPLRRDQIDQQLDRARIAQLRQRGDRLELQVLIDRAAR